MLMIAAEAKAGPEDRLGHDTFFPTHSESIITPETSTSSGDITKARIRKLDCGDGTGLFIQTATITNIICGHASSSSAHSHCADALPAKPLHPSIHCRIRTLKVSADYSFGPPTFR